MLFYDEQKYQGEEEEVNDELEEDQDIDGER